MTPPLDAVVMRALAKNPANRYPSAAEFRDDLERVRRGEPVHATPLLLTGAEATQVIRRQPTTVMAPVEETPKRSIWTGILIGALIVVVLGGGLYLLASSLLSNDGTPSPSRSTPTVVPLTYVNVLTEPLGKAQGDLAAAGFTTAPVVVASRVPAGDPSIGTVVAQDPDPTTTTQLAPDATITLTVARGPKTVTVPSDLIGKNVDDATAELTALGLNVDTTSQTSTTEVPGTVLDVNPAQGTPVSPGDTVTLTVAAEPDIVTVPPVTCESFGQAQHDITAAGLVPVVSSETRPTNPLCPNGNKVAAQDPPGNTQATVGSTVTLYPGRAPSPSPT